MRDFLEFASKYAMAIDHTNELALLLQLLLDFVKKKTPTNAKRQKKKFKCTKFAVQTTKMPDEQEAKAIGKGGRNFPNSNRKTGKTKTHMETPKRGKTQ